MFIQLGTYGRDEDTETPGLDLSQLDPTCQLLWQRLHHYLVMGGFSADNLPTPQHRANFREIQRLMIEAMGRDDD